MATKKASSVARTAVKVGAGVAAAAAAAAGFFFYASKDAAKNRKNAAAWAGKFKKDVIAKVKESGVDDTAAEKKAEPEVETLYKQAKNIEQAEVVSAAKELKGNWDQLKAEIEKGVAKGKKQATTAVKKAVKKATK